MSASVDHRPRPRMRQGQLIAYFRWHYGYGVWEQVIPSAAGRPGVIAAYLGPKPAHPPKSSGPAS